LQFQSTVITKDQLDKDIALLNYGQSTIFHKIMKIITHQYDHENNKCNCNEPSPPITKYISGYGGII
jgi:hypothetical protein